MASQPKVARKALILGNPAVTDWITRPLVALGFETVQRIRAPLPIDPNSGSELKSIFEAFREEYRPEARSQRAADLQYYVHPGTTSWAERPEFPAIAQEAGLVPISPPARVLSVLSDRLTWLCEAARRGIPNRLVSDIPLHSVKEIERAAASVELKFPFVVRSVRVGGALGTFVVHHPDDLRHRLPLWIEQHRLSIGEGIFFLERHLEAARRVTVPFCRFGDGQVEIFPTCDSSLQARFRKVIEFCPAESLDEELLQQLESWTALLAQQTGFVGVGSFEFGVESDSRAYVLDASPRLSSSFRLWEKVAGTSAVQWQIAALETYSGLSPEEQPELMPSKDGDGEWSSGLAMRIVAEDPLLHLPQPGILREISNSRIWKLAGASAEMSLGARAGEMAGLDPLAMIIVGANHRKRAVTVARGLLDQLWLAGGLQTNERFLAELIAHPWVKEGIFHSGFVDEEFIPALRPTPEIAACALALVASLSVPGGEPEWIVGDARMPTPGPSDLPWVGVGSPQRWEHAGRPGISGTVLLPDGRKSRVCAFPVAESRWLVRVGAWTLSVRPVRKLGRGKFRVSALAPGRVHSILFRQGAKIPPHEPIVIIESVGRLVPHALPREAVVTEWKVAAEQEVQAGDPLAELELATAAPTSH